MNSKVDDVASFYRTAFPSSEEPLCSGMACFVGRHAQPSRYDQAHAQEPRVHCLGRCYQAPASSLDVGRPRIEAHCPEPIVLASLVHGPTRSLDLYKSRGGCVGLQHALTDSEIALDEVRASNLRGRGGAGYPVFQKWQTVRLAQSDAKVVVANADEGDPGAYIDRFLLEDDPHRVLEGMAIAARAVGASEGIVYLRCEYPEARRYLEEAIQQERDAGLLGPSAHAGRPFDVSIHVGRGSYVCGEETALLNSIEGTRPVVRARPPYPAQQGLFGRPTLVHNIETLCALPFILSRSGRDYARFGFGQSRGTKVVCLNSVVRYPGLYEVEFGTPVSHVVNQIAGGLKSGHAQAIHIGGPLSGLLPAHLIDTSAG